MSIIVKAAHYAADRHRLQRRKDATKTPYINHPLEVARLISEVGGVDTPVVIVAAMLHDVVEDTGTSADEIEREFGPVIRHVVEEVTDDKSLPKSERKRLQVSHAQDKSYMARLVKLADKLSNLRDLIRNPIWEPARVQGYFVWSHAVVQGLRGTNTGLEAALDRVFHKRVKIVGPKDENGFQQVRTYPAIPSWEPAELEKLLEEYYKSLE